MEEAKLKFCLDPRNMDIVRDDSKERISRGRILEVEPEMKISRGVAPPVVADVRVSGAGYPAPLGVTETFTRAVFTWATRKVSL